MTGSAFRYDHVVVGAGVAGCVLAGRLAEGGRRVLLLDAGSASASPARGPSFFSALTEPGRTFTDVTVVATRGSPLIPYRRGRGVGGGAAINGMLATPPLPADFDRWAAEHDVPSWAWSEVGPSIDDHLLPTGAADPSEWGSVDRALVDAARALGHPACPDHRSGALGVGPAWFTRSAGQRVTPADVYLSLGGSNLAIRGDTHVSHVLVSSGRATGVVTDAGEVIEADEIVLSTGAFGTAALLQRTLASDRTHTPVRDHPSIRFTLRLREQNDTDGLVAATLLRWSSSDGEADLQLLPLNHLGPSSDPNLAGVLVVLLDARSVGSISVESEREAIALNLLDSDQDRRRMREAARHVVALLRAEPFTAIVDEVFIDDRGTPLADLAIDDDHALDRWMLASVGDTFHAGSSCPMGGPADPARVVDHCGLVVGTRSLRICDASIFPDLPTANPYLPLVMVAEQIGRRTLAAG